MSESQTGRSDLEVVCANYRTAHFQIRPDARMAPGLGQIERLHGEGSQDLFHMLFTAGFAGGVLRSFDTMQQLRGGDRANQGLGVGYCRRNPGMSNLPRSSAVRIDVSRINPMRISGAVEWHFQYRPRMRALHPAAALASWANVLPVRRKSVQRSATG